MGGSVYRFDNSWHSQWIQDVGTPKKSDTCPYYQFSFNAVIVELLNRGQGGRQMRIFSRYETLSVVAAVTLVLGVFVPDAELKKIIFGIGIFWFIASSLARKFSRQAHAHEDLADAFDDDGLIAKMPAALLSYYRERLIGSGYSIYRAGEEEFPILTMESWIPSPAEHPNGIFPTLELPDKKSRAFKTSALGDIYIAAAKEKGQFFEKNDIYALEEIGAVGDNGDVMLQVEISDYEKFVRSSQVLNAELLLHLKHRSEGGNFLSKFLANKRFGSDLRDSIVVGDFKNYACKIGLNVLTVERNIDSDRFFVMDRGHRNSKRPLEYPNAIHVVPAGTIQPQTLGRKSNSYDGPEDLLITNTLYREFAEEMFEDEVVHQNRLMQSVESGEVKFVVTGMGIDAASQKFEISALLITPDGYMAGFKSSESEGRNKAVNRDELTKYATNVTKIIPAGAMAIFQGLRYLDSISR